MCQIRVKSLTFDANILPSKFCLNRKHQVSKQDDDENKGGNMLTSEKMVVKASTGHVLVNKQPLVIFDAEPDKFDKIRMVKLTEEVYLKLKSK